VVNSSRYGFQIDIVGSSEDFFVEKAAVCTYLTFFYIKQFLVTWPMPNLLNVESLYDHN